MKETIYKPLGHKSYGSIAHLPGSRQGRDDAGLSVHQARICLSKPRDSKDTIVVLEKLDGSNVSVANIDGVLVPLGRSGHTAISSPHEQHRMLAAWVFENSGLFDWLKPGERLCGEWLAQAHGTRYKLSHAPFVAFDIMRNGHERATWAEVSERCTGIPTPHLIHSGSPISIDAAMERLGTHGFHGAVDPVEGAVWRAERAGKVDFLAKFVRSDKVDGKYLPGVSGCEEVWNWKP